MKKKNKEKTDEEKYREYILSLEKMLTKKKRYITKGVTGIEISITNKNRIQKIKEESNIKYNLDLITFILDECEKIINENGEK